MSKTSSYAIGTPCGYVCNPIGKDGEIIAIGGLVDDIKLASSFVTEEYAVAFAKTNFHVIAKACANKGFDKHLILTINPVS